MIIKKTKGKSFSGLLRYLLNDKKNGVQDRAEIVGGNMLGHTSRELSRQFAYSYKFKPDSPKFRKHTNKKTGEETYKEVKFKPVRHFSFRAADEDKDLTQEQVEQMATDFLEQMGYKNCSYIIVRHKNEDREGIHFHIATTQYGHTGKRVDEHRDVPKILDLAREYERQYGLRQLSNFPQPKPHLQPEPELEIEANSKQQPSALSMKDLTEKLEAKQLEIELAELEEIERLELEIELEELEAEDKKKSGRRRRRRMR